MAANTADDLKQVYLKKMGEVSERLTAVDIFVEQYRLGRGIPYLESAILQLRKVLENIALAAIAPNKVEYEKFRLEAESPRDFRKDYNGNSILTALEKVNPDFYPVPLEEPVKVGENEYRVDNKITGYLTREKFESLYDRLGKYLHSDNPWAGGKFVERLAEELPLALSEISGLLKRHRVILRNREFEGVWMVEALGTNSPRMYVVKANGPFAVSDSGGLEALK